MHQLGNHTTVHLLGNVQLLSRSHKFEAGVNKEACFAWDVEDAVIRASWLQNQSSFPASV